MSLLKDLKHANIVTLHDIVHTDKSLTLVFEYLVRPTICPLILHDSRCSAKMNVFYTIVIHDSRLEQFVFLSLI